MGGLGAHADGPAWTRLGRGGWSDLRHQRRAHSWRGVQQRQRGVHALTLILSSRLSDLVRYQHRSHAWPVMTKYGNILGIAAFNVLLGLGGVKAADTQSQGIPTSLVVPVIGSHGMPLGDS